jgi:signal transduction histidine kinase
MNNINKFLEPKYVSKYIGGIVVVLLIIFEALIGIQYAALNNSLWQLITVIVCSILLDGLCIISMFVIKKLKTNILFYACDFVLLLIICTITGSTYLSALYCIILSQFYFNIDDFASQFAVFIVSCIAYIASFIIGYLIAHAGTEITNYDLTVAIVSGGLLGIILLTVHFFIALFLTHYYRTNLRLTQALKEADESKAQLKVAYEQLSEKAVYEERNRIASDIHDNAGHSITAVIMQTEAAKLLVDTNPEEAKRRIASANFQAKNALDQMRESVHILAGRGDNSSIKGVIGEILAQTMDSTDVKIRSSIEEIELSENKRRFVTNTLKECIANAIRHGGATAFYVELKNEDGITSLTVSDNGSGLPDDFKEGFGMKGIREKATAFGGNVYLESESGDGLEITVKFPTKDNQEE